MFTLTKQSLSQPLLFIPIAALLTLSTGCRIEQEQAGQLPDVDVEVQPGQLPKYDVKGPDVNVKTVERTVTVPRVEVVQEEKTVEVPYIDVNLPGADRKEQTLTAEVAVPSTGYDLDIRDVYIVNNQLWVVARLDEKIPNAPRTTTSVSDRIVINAPEMPVRYYIIGKRPSGNVVEEYTFIDQRQAIQEQLSSGQQLYSRQTV
ncbi:hypothetical protein [Allocoleopsis franciscana]|uniref:Lipoprotein n=1 Tax=Allocoleopsis franciscana PCC 7113 TaxID=1173027 RepID=K9WLZ4_9CYAN|nr:hypothetical protein [Allocoleopsis franciscana]AFZ20826.1 hypothetical protein Mic7113_5170 [Allocoleopsis franciscana PCC 7113]